MYEARYDIEFDAERPDGQQWLVMRYSRFGFSTLAKCATEADARASLRQLRRRVTDYH